MAYLHDVRREAYEKRLQNLMAKYGQHAQEVIKEVTNTAIDEFSACITHSSHSHHGPTLKATSAVWESADSTTMHTHPEGIFKRIMGWFLGLNWEPCFYQAVVPFTTVVVLTFLLKGALDWFTKEQWEAGVRQLQDWGHWPRVQFDRLTLYVRKNALELVLRFHDQQYIRDWHKYRAVLWQKGTCTWFIIGLLLWITIMFRRERNTPGCWVKIHDLQHRGLHVPDWVYEASRKQHGDRVELVNNEWNLFEEVVTSTLFHALLKTEYLTATTTFSTERTVTKTVKIGGPTDGAPPKMGYEARFSDEPCTETVTVRETTTETGGATPREECTVTIRETASQQPDATSQADRTVTSCPTQTDMGYGTLATTTFTETETSIQYQSAEEQDPRISYIIVETVTKWEIIANVTPTTVQTVWTSTFTKEIPTTATVTGGTLVRISSIPTTVTVTSILTSTAEKVSTKTITEGKVTIPGCTIVKTFRSPSTITITDTSVLPGPICAPVIEGNHGEEEAQVCEDVGKSIGYCKQCQQYHCCELRP
ncbi:hypothetical protein DOTSEDRAFT_31090 [Dothistroma septosporum NZE10]|uniref:Uncharacterized protein n=1 Tax=Dothistroma septosporum (strain NZE10 / CBS 128990) TaxID=675120 RepID=N1Q529_DOTSN|nr:hypothetical protein DOTSEDRAFT_31090 [Dothistroma septosporum NZE10]